jgi:CBS domain containing-hemolysin-like protein
MNGEPDTLWHRIRHRIRAFQVWKKAESVRETIEDLIEETASPISDQEERLLRNILRLRDVTAHDVMVPSADIVAVDSHISREGLMKLITDEGHSRYPVYRKTLDDAVGLVHIKDVFTLLASGQPFVLQKITRRILFVPPSIRVLDLMLEMRIKRTHMALVVDEFGGIDGLVTNEDLIEQIVGEIEDEHDEGIEPDFILRPDGVIEADARVPLSEFEQRTGRLLEDDEREEVDTLGGLVSFLAGRVPARGELIVHPSGIEFEILDADPRRVRRLRVRNLPGPEKDRAA